MPKLPQKKTFSAAEKNKAAVIEKIATFNAEIATIPAKNLVFLDETSSYLDMTRTHARSTCGIRAIVERSAKKQSNISLSGAIGIGGIIDVYPYDGGVDGERFSLFLERLFPKLPPETVLVMDNVRVHHMGCIKEQIAQAGFRVIYQPPYSPELNPIEEAWSVIKGVFKEAGAKTIPAYIATMKKAVETITPDKAKNFFKHAGYVPQSTG